MEKKENIQFATNWTCIATTTSFSNGDQSCKSINFTSLEIIGTFCSDVLKIFWQEKKICAKKVNMKKKEIKC